MRPGARCLLLAAAACNARRARPAARLPATNESALRWLESSVEGYCTVTESRDRSTVESCRTREKGWFALGVHVARRGWLAATLHCLRACSTCAGCKYVSLSPRFAECDWFRECDTSRLLQDVSSYRTAPVQTDARATTTRRRDHALVARLIAGLGLRVAAQSQWTSDDGLDLGQAGQHGWPTRSVPLEIATRPPPRSALIGIVSGSAHRRHELRCTWVGALAEHDVTSSTRVLFIIGLSQARVLSLPTHTMFPAPLTRAHALHRSLTRAGPTRSLCPSTSTDRWHTAESVHVHMQ